MPPRYQIGMQAPQQPAPRISVSAQPSTSQPEDWQGYVNRSNGVQAPAPRAATGNPLADHYQAQSDEAMKRVGQPDPSWGPDTRKFYADRQAFWGGPNANSPQAKTVYHANGSISNPPQQDPGFRVYNNVSRMPASDQADIANFRNGGGQEAPWRQQQSQMMPDPSKQTPAIGVPARGQSPAVAGGAIGFQSVPPSQPAPTFSSHQEMRDAMLSGLARDMQSAHGAGDTSKLYDLFAQRASLDNGGFAGHAKFMQDKAIHDAQVAKLGGAAGGIGLAKGPDGLLDLDRARSIGLRETNSAAGGDEFANNAAVQNYATLEKQGKPYTIDPALLPAIIESRAPHLKGLFQADANGPAMSPQEMLSGANQRDPGMFNKPSSLTAQATLAMIRQLHGDGLEKQLAMPANPLDYAPSAGSLIGAAIGPTARLSVGGAGAALDNLWNWRGSVLNPYGSYIEQSKANALYNALANPNKK